MNRHRERQVVGEAEVALHPCHRHYGDRGQRHEQPAPIPASAVEAEDEGQQVQRERQDPQERDRGHVLREVVGDGEEQERRDAGQHDPLQARREARRRPGVEPHRRRTRADDAPQAVDRGGDAQHPEDRVAAGPEERLDLRRDQRLEQDRIRQQRREGREVRQREQPVRRSPPGARTRPARAGSSSRAGSTAGPPSRRAGRGCGSSGPRCRRASRRCRRRSAARRGSARAARRCTISCGRAGR